MARTVRKDAAEEEEGIRGGRRAGEHAPSFPIGVSAPASVVALSPSKPQALSLSKGGAARLYAPWSDPPLPISPFEFRISSRNRGIEFSPSS
jgi:hypothetical protein